jgi:hypothetical protein
MSELDKSLDMYYQSNSRDQEQSLPVSKRDPDLK